VEFDLRKAHPYLVYDQWRSKCRPVRLGTATTYLVRMEEMRQSVRLLRQCLDKIPAARQRGQRAGQHPDGKRFCPPNTSADQHGGIDSSIHPRHAGRQRPAGEVYFSAENPRANWVLHQQQRRRHAYRLKIRSPPLSTSASSAPHAGHVISDTVSIFGSLDFVMGECDR